MTRWLFIVILIPLIECGYSEPKSKHTEVSQNPLPKTKKHTNPWSLGVGAIFAANPYKDTDQTILPLPIIRYRGENLTWNGPSASYKFVEQSWSQTRIKAFLYPQDFESANTDNARLSQLNDRHYLFMLGLEQRFTTYYGDIQLGISGDVTGQTNGYRLNTKYSQRFTMPLTEKLIVFTTPAIGISYTSYRITDHFYGISTSESNRSGLNTYTPGGAVSPYVSVRFVINVSENWNIFSSTQLNHLPDKLYDSPMIGKRYTFTTIVSLTYDF